MTVAEGEGGQPRPASPGEGVGRWPGHNEAGLIAARRVA